MKRARALSEDAGCLPSSSPLTSSTPYNRKFPGIVWRLTTVPSLHCATSCRCKSHAIQCITQIPHTCTKFTDLRILAFWQVNEFLYVANLSLSMTNQHAICVPLAHRLKELSKAAKIALHGVEFVDGRGQSTCQ